MSVQLTPAGRLEQGEVLEARLTSPQAEIRLLNWGCALRSWIVATPQGPRQVALGLARVEDYPQHSPAFGAICGRVANRISGARFTLAGEEIRLSPNEGPNLLHGGTGLARRLWRAEPLADATGLRFSYDSPDGEDGFPGAVAFEVTIRLDGARLSWEMRATPDRPTPIALAQHVYWNLDGTGPVSDHRLRLDAPAWAELGPGQIPTGRLRPAGDGLPDFRELRRLRDDFGAPMKLDHAWALTPGRDPALPAAEVLSSQRDMRLRLWTDQPSLQVYDAPGLSVSAPAQPGPALVPYAGLCLEAQNFPDAVNRPEFPDPIHSPARPYLQRISVEIAPLA